MRSLRLVYRRRTRGLFHKGMRRIKGFGLARAFDSWLAWATRTRADVAAAAREEGEQAMLAQFASELECAAPACLLELKVKVLAKCWNFETDFTPEKKT